MIPPCIVTLLDSTRMEIHRTDTHHSRRSVNTLENHYTRRRTRKLFPIGYSSWKGEARWHLPTSRIQLLGIHLATCTGKFVQLWRFTDMHAAYLIHAHTPSVHRESVEWFGH